MYYSEAIINGLLHYKTEPDGAWKPVNQKQLTQMYANLKKENAQMKKQLAANKKK
jgi:hypothetical protein